MITQEREFLKARAKLDRLIEIVQQAGREHTQVDEVERSIFTELLSTGFHLISAFVAAAGDGDMGETLEVPIAGDGTPPDEGPAPATRTLRRLEKPHTRSFVSIFGKLEITRYVYGTREGQKIEAVPLDAQLGLPAGDFSYLLEDWQQRMCVKESFEEATGNLKEMLGVAPSVRAAEVMNRQMAEFAPDFRTDQPPPPADEEGELLVFTADGKGVPMRRPPDQKRPHGQRRTKGQKANKKKMSYVGAVYTIDRFIRAATDVIDELKRKTRAKHRPVPQHKRVAAEMTQVIEGEECNGRVSLFGELSDEVQARNPKGRKTVVAVMDGEPALWEVLKFFLPQAIGILDIFHVLERLWLAAYVFHPEGSAAAEQFVTDRLRMLLEGHVGGVIGGLKQMLTKHALNGSNRKTLAGVIGYFENNRQHMKYGEYLAAGYPIGSGVAEGACRHLVKDRMEQTGMRWTVEGAQSMLHTRALYLNDDWNAFLAYRIEQEQNSLYPYKTSLAL